LKRALLQKGITTLEKNIDQISLKLIVMETISMDELKQFLKYGNFPLQPTQQRICLPIIQRIYRKMQIGVKFENINVDNLLLINGHHRYICALLLQKELSINEWNSPPNVMKLLCGVLLLLTQMIGSQLRLLNGIICQMQPGVK